MIIFSFLFQPRHWRRVQESNPVEIENILYTESQIVSQLGRWVFK